jgi:hypothetical protein
VISEDLKAETRTVQLGPSDGARVQIVSGIQPGERVVTRSYQTLKEGATVKLNDGKPPKEGASKDNERGDKSRGKGQ